MRIEKSYISNQFPIPVKASNPDQMYGLYELNALRMTRPKKLYGDLVAFKKQLESRGIKSINLRIKAINI